MMTDVLPILLGVAMAATLAVLFVGVIGFAVGGKSSGRMSTRLMTARVVFQGVALALMAAIVALTVL